MRVKKYCFAESFLDENAAPLRGGKKIGRLRSRGTLRVLEEAVIKAIVSGPILTFSRLRVAVKINLIDPYLVFPIESIFTLVFLNITHLFPSISNRYSCSFKRRSSLSGVLKIFWMFWYFFLSFFFLFEFWRDDNEKTFSFWSMETWTPSVMAAIFRGLPRNCQ